MCSAPIPWPYLRKQDFNQAYCDASKKVLGVVVDAKRKGDFLYASPIKNFMRRTKQTHDLELEQMDDPNITMEKYIRVEEEKAQKCGKVFNWETAKYGKICYDEDIHDLGSVETEFPAIAFNNGVSSEKMLSCEPTVSSLNEEINIRISFDDSDDEDYTVVFDKNSVSYKLISTNNLKTDSENDNEKVMPSPPPPEPTDLAAKKSTILVKYLQSGILA
ncbi:hypothetical protein Tco_0472040 [Tanacetum coccineum]